ncbi:1,4-dihydroxy-2-naphthoate polyprenyltransferase [Ascidiimonas aurantiaca]|uniref:1,4-dihydroxy-2-naphthoate polyprenyltransferase n=1 Tax=Ascidiimonas aurantiaca TaxID=1685432 RepID=UPI0030EE5343
MPKLTVWIAAARFRTLPLSVSGIIVGTAIAASKGYFDITICILALLTTVSFQVLSNFANDYGDGVKGTDNEDRIGPARAVQTGAITSQQMKKAIYSMVVLSFLLSALLIYVAFGRQYPAISLFFLVLGILAIAAAIKYTVGNSAYGYHGYGDVFVFIFFGLVSVMGSYFLYTRELDWSLIFPAFSMGLLSTGVLNLNNMRDRESDEASGKNTLVVKIGAEFSKYYHYYLLVSAMFFSVVYLIIAYREPVNFIFFIAFIPITLHILRVYKNKDPKKLDPELKKLALSIFFFALLFAISINIFL